MAAVTVMILSYLDTRKFKDELNIQILLNNKQMCRKCQFTKNKSYIFKPSNVSSPMIG